jgi:ferredoxin-type protein NapH
MAAGYVVPNAVRCVQCGICTYNCPQGIDVRAYAWQGKPVTDSRCILCGECVARCPRGVLSIEKLASLETTLKAPGSG